jgi:hypothetical protein
LVKELVVTGISMGVFVVFGQILALPMVSVIGLVGVTLRVASEVTAGDPQLAVTIQRNLFRSRAVVIALTIRVSELDPLNSVPLLILVNAPLFTDLCHWYLLLFVIPVDVNDETTKVAEVPWFTN